MTDLPCALCVVSINRSAVLQTGFRPFPHYSSPHLSTPQPCTTTHIPWPMGLDCLWLRPRTLGMAQHVVHHVVGVIAPGWVPAWCSDGFKGYLPAIVGHFGVWVHPERRQDKGPWPKPRWLPLRTTQAAREQYHRHSALRLRFW